MRITHEGRSPLNRDIAGVIEKQQRERASRRDNQETIEQQKTIEQQEVKIRSFLQPGEEQIVLEVRKKLHEWNVKDWCNYFENEHQIREAINQVREERRQDITTPQTPDVIPSETSDIIPSETSDIIPSETSDIIPSETSDIIPSETSDIIPSETSDIIPSETSDIIPSETSDIIPSETSDIIPSETSDIIELIERLSKTPQTPGITLTPNETLTPEGTLTPDIKELIERLSETVEGLERRINLMEARLDAMDKEVEEEIKELKKDPKKKGFFEKLAVVGLSILGIVGIAGSILYSCQADKNKEEVVPVTKIEGTGTTKVEAGTSTVEEEKVGTGTGKGKGTSTEKAQVEVKKVEKEAQKVAKNLKVLDTTPKGNVVYNAETGTFSSKTTSTVEAVAPEIEAGIIQLSDGTTIEKMENGTIITITPDGIKTIETPDKIIVTMMPDGTETIKTPDGRITEILGKRDVTSTIVEAVAPTVGVKEAGIATDKVEAGTEKPGTDTVAAATEKPGTDTATSTVGVVEVGTITAKVVFMENAKISEEQFNRIKGMTVENFSKGANFFRAPSVDSEMEKSTGMNYSTRREVKRAIGDILANNPNSAQEMKKGNIGDLLKEKVATTIEAKGTETLTAKVTFMENAKITEKQFDGIKGMIVENFLKGANFFRAPSVDSEMEKSTGMNYSTRREVKRAIGDILANNPNSAQEMKKGNIGDLLKISK